MSTLQRILAATDFSESARHALERAAQISKEIAATLDLLHVANLDPLEKLRRQISEVPADLQQRLLDDAREKLQQQADGLQERHGVVSGVRVVTGPLLTRLVGEIESQDADLLVCGASGQSRIRHWLLGSTAERLLAGSVCPTLVVKQAAGAPYRKLLVPVDFSSSSLRAIRHARGIAPQAKIVLLHVFEVPFEGYFRHAGVDDEIIEHYRAQARQEAEGKLRALCEAAGLPPVTRLVVLHGNPAVHITEKAHDCDLIVIGKHGESVWEELLLGSVTRRVLSESRCDVLVSV